MSKMYVKHDYRITGKDYVESEGSGGNYSEEEQDTGLTWIDGKHIYQKTVKFETFDNGTNDSPVNIAHGIADISQVVDYDVYELMSNGGIRAQNIMVSQVSDHAYVDGNWIFNIVGVNATNIMYRSGTAKTNLGMIATIRYTKTTE